MTDSRNLELALRIKATVDGAQSVEDLGDQLKGLGDSAKAAETPAQDLGDSLGQIASSGKQADTVLESTAQAAGDLTQELQRGNQASSDAAQNVENLGEATRRTSAKLDDNKKKTGDLSDAIGSLAGKFGISGDAFEALTGKLAGAAAIGALAAAFVNANREADRLAQQFQAMTGNAASAQEEITFLTGVANRWGVAVNDLAPAYLRLAAATKGSTAEGEATRKMIDDLTAAYMNAGADAGELQEVMEILGETFAEGRVSVDALKEGMQEDMPPAIQAATTAVLENDAALKEMLSTGDAATEDFMPAFAAALRKHIGGSQTQVDSVSASFTRLTERVNALFVSIDNQTGAMTGFDTVLKGAIKTLETGVAGVEILSEGFALVGKAVGATVGALATGGNALDAVGEQAASSGERIAKSALSLLGLKTASEEAADRQKQMQKQLQALREETDPYGAALDRLKKKQEDANAEFKRTGDTVKLTQAALEEFLKAPEKNLDLAGVLKLSAALKIVGQQAEDSGQQVSNTLGQELSKLTNEQLTKLEQQARAAMAAASTGSETSRQAFMELGQIVEGVVLARLQRLGVDGPEALRGISVNAKSAIDDFTALASNADLSANTIEQAFEGALAVLDNPAEVESFRQKILELGASGTLSGEQVERALLLIQKRIQEVSGDPAFDALKTRLEDIRAESEQDLALADRQATVNQARIQAAIALAKAKGDEAAAAEATAEATAAEVKTAEERITQLKRQKTEIDQHIQLLYQQANADGLYSQEERKVIEALQDKSAALGENIARTEAHLPLQKQEAEQAEIMAGPIGQLTRLYAEQVQEHQRAADSSARYYSAQVQEAEGALKLAQIKGDAQAIDKAQAALDEQKIQQAQALANARATEAQDAANALSAKAMELAADGELSAADQQQLADLEAVVAAKRAAADAAQTNADQMQAEARAAREKAAADAEAAAAAQREKDAAESRASAEKAASKVMSDALSVLRETGGELDVLSQRFYELQGAVTSHAAGWDGWAAGTARAAQEVKTAYETQKTAVDAMTAALQNYADTGEWSASVQQMMIRAGGDLTSQFDLMDQQSLDGLRSALDSANDKLREMQEITQSARDKLASLNADLLEAQGQDAKAELLRQQLDYQQQLAEIEKQRQEAENAGNTEALSVLNQQRDVLEEINRIKTADIERTAQQTQQTRTATSSASSSAASASSAPTARYEIKLTAGTKSLSASTDSNPQSFLDELENAQRRSA